MRRLLACLLIAVSGLTPYVVMAGQSIPDAQEMPCHNSAPEPDPAASGDCGLCGGASHCCAASLLPAFASAPALPVGAAHFPGGQRVAVGVVFAPLDPPPLAA